MSRFILKEHRFTEPEPHAMFEIIERTKAHALAAEVGRRVVILASEGTARLVLNELNRQRREGVIEGMTRFAWWRDGEEFVGTCGTRLKDAVAEVEKEIR